jgi:CO/xanthine dehydrogenase FAD-binding subunit
VEAALEGQEPSVDAIVAAARRVPEAGLNFAGDLFAGAGYRAHLTQVLTERAVTRAVERAGLRA